MKDAKPVLTNEQYCEALTPTCPACGSSDAKEVSPLRLSGDQSSVTLDRICTDCLASWTEVFHIVGYTGLNKD